MMAVPPEGPLNIGLWLEESEKPRAVGRVAMVARRAQLEWHAAIVDEKLELAPPYYAPEAGLLEARGSDFAGLHGFLADSLPDSWGSLLMKRRLAKHGVNWDALNALQRLAVVGKHGRGALIYEPEALDQQPTVDVDLDTLAAQSQAVLIGEDTALIEELAKLGGNSGGARPKVHVGFADDGTRCVAEDDVGAGFESWIVKFRALTDPVDIGPVEQCYAQMARDAGIDMSPSQLLPAKEGPSYFATKRFDRPLPGQRLHMMSLAGAVEAPHDRPSVSYDGFFRATYAITRHDDDVKQAFLRMLFNILACNRDDHTRQHAYLMGNNGQWRLAPAYDLTYSEGPGGEHYMDVAGEGRHPTRRHVEQLAKTHGIAPPLLDSMIDHVRASLAQWDDLADTFGVGPSKQEIAGRLAQIDKSFQAS